MNKAEEDPEEYYYDDNEEEEDIADPLDFVDEFDPQDLFTPGSLLPEDGGQGLSSFNLAELLEHCVEPTILDAIRHAGRLLFWCLLFRILSQAFSSRGISSRGHLLSALLGLVVLWNFFGHLLVHQVALATLAYPALILATPAVSSSPRHRRGLAVAIICFAYNMLCEIFVTEPAQWHQIRGAQMILSMKVISLGFDMDASAKEATLLSVPEATMDHLQEQREGDKVATTEPRPKEDTEEVEEDLSSQRPRKTRQPPKASTARRRPFTRGQKATQAADPQGDESQSHGHVPNLLTPPSVLAYFGYAFCPGTAVFGPWVKHSDYLNIYQDPVWDLAWVMKVFFTLAFSLLFLTISTCWNSWLIPDNSWKWWLAYRDAMSFRASHYFVSYVGEAAAVASGFGRSGPPNGSGPGEGGSGGSWNGVLITRPHDVEVPRSLLDVVVSWNIPMHRWLKTYCFRTTLPKFGGFVAVLVTYTASVMLHGLNFQLGAVLFSLGFYTFTEHTLRRRLSLRFDASVAARVDPGKVFRHKEGQAWVVLVNFFFGLLACFHLAYLGVMFNQQEDIMAEGYSWRHTLSKWEALNYASHLVVLVTFSLVWLL